MIAASRPDIHLFLLDFAVVARTKYSNGKPAGLLPSHSIIGLG
ncbi:MAG: hypothetical protein RL839_15495 [Gammaproteobacteria bacterium]